MQWSDPAFEQLSTRGPRASCFHCMEKDAAVSEEVKTAAKGSNWAPLSAKLADEQ